MSSAMSMGDIGEVATRNVEQNTHHEQQLYPPNNSFFFFPQSNSAELAARGVLHRGVLFFRCVYESMQRERDVLRCVRAC